MMIPMIYVKDKDTGSIHLIGTNCHDALLVCDGENEKGYKKANLIYRNMQNHCESGETYEFLGERDDIGYGMFEYYIEMMPWQEAIEIYKRFEAEKAESDNKRDEIINAVFEK